MATRSRAAVPTAGASTAMPGPYVPSGQTPYQLDPLNPGQHPPTQLPDPGAAGGDWFAQNMPPSDPSQGALTGSFGSGLSGGDFQGGGGASAPTGGYYGQFVAPTDVTMQNDPGYRFRLDEQRKGITNSQFGKGMGLTGGALRSLAQYQGDLASQEYGNVFNRALQGDTFNRDTAFGNQDRALNSFVASSNASLGQQQAGLNAYLANRDTFWGDNDRLFGRNFSLASLGQNAATGYGNNLGQYGANGGNLYTNQGNSNAASTIAQGNALSGGIYGGLNGYASARR